mmetsp:Transcript_61453/g.146559  ORF Transcript_61453/g.146559 Transcript_61453/m.146559 type:complete len:187 (-) Transcript_61453:106-666(-)
MALWFHRLTMCSCACDHDEDPALNFNTHDIRKAVHSSETAYTVADGHFTPAPCVLEDGSKLKEFLRSFVQKMRSGIPCTLLHEDTGERWSSQYSIDDCHGKIIVAGQACELSSIVDVFAGGDDDNACFSPEVWRSLKLGEELSLVRITSCDRSGGWTSVCFLDGSLEGRDVLLDCLRILCIQRRPR